MVKIEFEKKSGEDVVGLERILTSIRNRTKYLVAGKYVITVKKKTTPRSVQQNRLYRLWLRTISRDTGNTMKALDKTFKDMFLEHTTEEVFGRTTETTMSTTELNTKTFSEYLDRINEFASTELGMQLPTPDDAVLIDLYNFNEEEL